MTASVFFQRYAFALLVIAIVVVAGLVNRFAPTRKPRVRRTVVLLGLFVMTWSIAKTAAFLGFGWSKYVSSGADLLASYTVISLVGITIFDLILPAVRIRLVSITSDLLLAVGYVVATAGMIPGGGLNSILATSAVVSAVLAISLQATLGNLFGGIALRLDGSVEVGDWIQLENGRQGKVREVRWRHTVLETRDWTTIVVPNSLLLQNSIIVLGRRDGHPRQWRIPIQFAVDHRYSPETVIHAVDEALNAAPIERVALTPAPHTVCLDLMRDGRESYATYAVRYWLTDLSSDESTNSHVRTRIYAALRRAGIPLARPTQTLFLTPNDEEAEKKRTERHHNRRYDAVRSVELFAKFTEEELQALAERVRYAPFTKGETVTRQGAVAHWLYILTKGSVKVRMRTDDGKSKSVATLHAPNFFGEMGLMTGEPRSADVVALTNVDCYRLDKEGFQKFIAERPEIANDVSETLTKRKIEYISAREGLNEEGRRSREITERERTLTKIRDFFGLVR